MAFTWTQLKAYLVDVVLATRDPGLCGASELAAFIRFELLPEPPSAWRGHPKP